MKSNPLIRFVLVVVLISPMIPADAKAPNQEKIKVFYSDIKEI